MSDLNESEIIQILLSGLQEAAGTAKDLYKLTKSPSYNDVARNLSQMYHLAKHLTESKAMTKQTLTEMVDRAAAFQGIINGS